MQEITGKSDFKNKEQTHTQNDNKDTTTKKRGFLMMRECHTKLRKYDPKLQRNGNFLEKYAQ